jgi:hypothetical protein
VTCDSWEKKKLSTREGKNLQILVSRHGKNREIKDRREKKRREMEFKKQHVHRKKRTRGSEKNGEKRQACHLKRKIVSLFLYINPKMLTHKKKR